MNKQDFQQKIKDMKPPKFFTAVTLGDAYEAGFEEAKYNALYNSCFLNEPKKPVVPQFVADWYEDNRDDFEFNLYRLCIDYYNCDLDMKMMIWFRDKRNKSIQTLVAMHQVGYEVKKEKLYRAKNRHTGEYLCYCFGFFHDKNSSSENKRFTAEEKRWEELGYWDNDLYIFEEAEGEDE